MEKLNPPKMQFMFVEQEYRADVDCGRTAAVHVIVPDKNLPGGLYWQQLSLEAFQRRHRKDSQVFENDVFKGYRKRNFYFHLVESGKFNVDIVEYYRNTPHGKGVIECLSKDVHTFRYFSAWDFYRCIDYDHKTATLRGYRMRIK